MEAASGMGDQTTLWVEQCLVWDNNDPGECLEWDPNGSNGMEQCLDDGMPGMGT